MGVRSEGPLRGPRNRARSLGLGRGRASATQTQTQEAHIGEADRFFQNYFFEPRQLR